MKNQHRSSAGQRGSSPLVKKVTASEISQVAGFDHGKVFGVDDLKHTRFLGELSHDLDGGVDGVGMPETGGGRDVKDAAGRGYRGGRQHQPEESKRYPHHSLMIRP
jgi:hypothetical protein